MCRAIAGSAGSRGLPFATCAVEVHRTNTDPSARQGARPGRRARRRPRVGAGCRRAGAELRLLQRIDGDGSVAGFGGILAATGDLDRNGADDLVVGGLFGREVLAFDGVTASALHRLKLTGFMADPEGLEGIGDVDGDGHADIVVNEALVATARVVSGRTGQDIWVFANASSLRMVGDLDHDGHIDLMAAMGLPAVAKVYSGKDRRELFSFGPSNGFGFRCGPAGDTNADGFADLLLADVPGALELRSGKDGAVLRSYPGASGWAAGDVNNDGFADLILRDRAGAIEIRSGKDDAVLYTWPSAPVLRSAGDINGDGYGDLVVGDSTAAVHGPDTGQVTVYSGRDRSVLFHFDGEAAGDQLGTSVAGVLDIDGDGRSDLLVGAPSTDHGGTNFGSVYVFAGGPTRSVFPVAAVASEGNLNSVFPLAVPQCRLQLLMEAAGFAGPRAGMVSGMALRRDEGTAAYAGGTVDLRVDLGFAATTARTMSARFLDNWKGTPTLVMLGRVAVPPQPALLQGPGPFNIVVPFASPLSWNGENLLCEIQATNATTTGYMLDAVLALPGTASPIGQSCNGPTGMPRFPLPDPRSLVQSGAIVDRIENATAGALA